MKSIFKILVLGVVPILAATAVVDQASRCRQGLSVDLPEQHGPCELRLHCKHRQGQAVTVLVQYYNDAMESVLWYLRVVPADSNLLIDPFNHMIPGSDPATNVAGFLGDLPARSSEDDGPGINSGHFVITVTAVGASVKCGRSRWRQSIGAHQYTR